MLKRSHIITAFLLVAAVAAASFGQTPANVKPSIIPGDVVSVESGKIVFTTKDGEMTATLSGKTEFKKVPADNRKMSAAVPAAVSDIAAGDKIVVSGFPADDKKTVPARTVYLMSKAEIDQAKAKDLERWKTRGISGKVKAVNPDTRQITVDISGLMGTRSITLTPKAEAVYKRYAPNSIKYSEAQASSFGEIGVGDGIRAVGDRSADGTSFAAEEVLSGAFQTHAGTVKSVDAAKNEVVITELQTKKDVTVSLGSASVMRKFPEQMAQMLAARQAGGGGQTPVRMGGGQAGPGGPGGPRGGIDDMLERFPTITAADLKAGDMIAVSSTKTASLDRITAIKLLAGVEPFIRMAQMSAERGQGRGQGAPSLSIPGLDGFDSP
jgi:ribosomal protein L24